MILEARLAVDEAVAAVAAANWERHAWPRWMSATDRVLDELEVLNRDGVERVPLTMWARMVESLGELPADVRSLFSRHLQVLALLDSTFDLQEALFRLRDPGYRGDAEGVPADPALKGPIRARVTGRECYTVGDIVQGFPQFLDPVVRATVQAMRESGELVDGEVDGRRRFEVGEVAGG